jgi:hypothetical protein
MLGNAQTRCMGMQNERAQLPNAPRPSSQASARPGFEVRHARKRGRDVGLVESGFRPAITGLAGAFRFPDALS